MDCGSGIAHRLAVLGIRWQDITHVALTHFDADHVVDLVTLMVAWRYGDLPPRSAPLDLIGPVGLTDFLARLSAAHGKTVRDPGFPVHVREITTDDVPLTLADGVTIRARKVPHTAESVAYAIEHAGLRVVYTGDTAFDPSLAEWAGGCDVMLCECSLPEAMAVPTHLTPNQCGQLAAIAGPKLLVLTHFYPPVEHVDIEAVVRERYSGAIALATDGYSIDLGASV
jgi:ribonuclease BN (tRNA processing enzyme)